MLLEFNGIYQSSEMKKSKNNKDYLSVSLKEQITNNNVEIFVFSDNLIKRIEKLNQNDEVCVVFNRFYDVSKKKEVFYVKDVVVIWQN